MTRPAFVGAGCPGCRRSPWAPPQGNVSCRPLPAKRRLRSCGGSIPALASRKQAGLRPRTLPTSRRGLRRRCLCDRSGRSRDAAGLRGASCRPDGLSCNRMERSAEAAGSSGRERPPFLGERRSPGRRAQPGMAPGPGTLASTGGCPREARTRSVLSCRPGGKGALRAHAARPIPWAPRLCAVFLMDAGSRWPAECRLAAALGGNAAASPPAPRCAGLPSVRARAAPRAWLFGAAG